MYILLITFVKMQGVELGGVYSLENPATDSVVVGVVVGEIQKVVVVVCVGFDVILSYREVGPLTVGGSFNFQ